jgi:hypothetical protein
MANPNRMAQQRGSILLTCLMLIAVLSLLIISVSGGLQSGWRQLGYSWQHWRQAHALFIAITHIAGDPVHWAGQACFHPALMLSDDALRAPAVWRELNPCTFYLADNDSVQFIVEELPSSPPDDPLPAYRVSARLAAWMQQLTVTVDAQGRLGRQAWRNVV